MSIENAVRNRGLLLESVGKTILNSRYPNEFELYVIALELVDADNKTLKYFIFPVNPSSIDEANQRITSVKKTAGGVVALGSTSFVPIDINLTGNFGRKFRVLLGSDYVDFISSFKTADGHITADSVQAGVEQIFDDRVKTGYGCLKILEQICDEAELIDDKGPRRLIWYNLAFGTAYVVRPMNFRITMSQDSNMIHGYVVSFKAIAPLSALREAQDLQDKLTNLSSTSYVQGQVDRAVNALTKIFY